MTTERYRILRKLGEGGCGRTYLVRDRKLGKLWAMKEWKPEAEMEDGTGENSGEEEFRILRELDSPCFPRLVEYFWKDGKRYLVMDWVQGQTLEEKLIQDGPFGWREAADCALQLCGALEKLHGGKPAILHLDLKPSNIILTQDGPRLIDFGSAVLAGERENESGKKRVPAITPGFAAPELYEDGKADAGSDVYSLGVVLQVMLTGKKPQAEPEKPAAGSRIFPFLFWKRKRESDLKNAGGEEQGSFFLGRFSACFCAFRQSGIGEAEPIPSRRDRRRARRFSVPESGLQPFLKARYGEWYDRRTRRGDCWASGTISEMRFEGQQGNGRKFCRKMQTAFAGNTKNFDKKCGCLSV